MISILLPSLARARRSAYQASCLSNLRTQGQAISMYALCNKGYLPPSSTADNSQHIGSILAKELGVGDGTIAKASNAEKFRTRAISLCRAGFTVNSLDPTKVYNQNNYTAHPLLMPDITLKYPAGFPRVPNPTTVIRRPYRLAFIKNASEIALVWDGTQNFATGNAHYDSRMIDNQRISDTSNTSPGVTFLLTSSGVDLSQSIDAGPNQDAPDETINATTKVFANVRWRHGSNNSANFLFVDGHAEPRRMNSRSSTDILRRNIYVPNQW